MSGPAFGTCPVCHARCMLDADNTLTVHARMHRGRVVGPCDGFGEIAKEFQLTSEEYASHEALRLIRVCDHDYDEAVDIATTAAVNAYHLQFYDDAGFWNNVVSFLLRRHRTETAAR